MDKKQMEMLSVKSAIERMVHNYISTYQGMTNGSKEFFSAVERLVASFFVGNQIDNNYLVRSLNNGDLEVRFSTKGHCTNVTFMLPKELKWKLEIKEAKVEIEEGPMPDTGDKNPPSALRGYDQPKEIVSTRKNWNGKEWEGYDGKPLVKKTAEIERSPYMYEDRIKAAREEIDDVVKQLAQETRDEIASLKEGNSGDVLTTDGVGSLTWSNAGSDWLSIEPTPMKGMLMFDETDHSMKVYNGEEWVKMTADYLRDSMNEANVRVGKDGNLEIYKNGQWVGTPKTIVTSPSTPEPQVEQAPVQEEFDPYKAYERAKKAVKGMI